MPKGSAELTLARRGEIIAACAELYETMSFKEISLKDIAQKTSFTRTSIYNYFITKEEIFLALLQREYEEWLTALHTLCVQAAGGMTVSAFADAMAATLDARRRLLKITTMNIYDMEANSRPEKLAEFKRVFGASLTAVEDCLSAAFPSLSPEQRSAFVYAFFPFIYGLHAYTEVADKQRQALADAGVDFHYHSVSELARHCITALLSGV